MIKARSLLLNNSLYKDVYKYQRFIQVPVSTSHPGHLQIKKIEPSSRESTPNPRIKDVFACCLKLIIDFFIYCARFVSDTAHFFVLRVSGPRQLSINEQAERACIELSQELWTLEHRMERVNTFVRNHPRLAALCQKCIAEDKDDIAEYSVSELEEGDLNDPIQRQCALQLRLLDLNFIINEHKELVERHPKIERCIREEIAKDRSERGEFPSRPDRITILEEV